LSIARGGANQGERGVSVFTGIRADDTRLEVQGCDLFTFRGGKISLKNSYRKNRPSLAAINRWFTAADGASGLP
jgi:hypothetical protein